MAYLHQFFSKDTSINPVLLKLENDISAVALAIEEQAFSLSISPLLGNDYLFIQNDHNHPLLAIDHLTATLQEILSIYALDAKQTKFIMINNDEFIRISVSAEQNTVRVTAIEAITQDEQREFLQMIFGCSSLC